MARRKIKAQKEYMKRMRDHWAYVSEKEIDDEEFLRRYLEYLNINCVSSSRQYIIDRLSNILETLRNE